MVRSLIFAVVVCAGTSVVARAQEAPARATLEDMKWFAGEWTGTGLGGVADEIWSSPASGAMMGMFRLVKDGKVVFYEFLTLVEQDGSLVLKLKHFHPDLVGWEEKADSVKFPLLKIEDGEIAFDGLKMRREGEDGLTVIVTILNRKDGSVREEPFNMRRVRPR